MWRLVGKNEVAFSCYLSSSIIQVFPCSFLKFCVGQLYLRKIYNFAVPELYNPMEINF